MDLSELRNEIDQIDDQLISLFVRRMGISAQVAEYKQQHNLPIFVPEREQCILETVALKAGPEMAEYAKTLYAKLFELSRCYQAQLQNTEAPQPSSTEVIK